VKRLLDLILDSSRDLMKYDKACEKILKQPQSWSSKPTPRSKKNKTKEKHKEGRTLAKIKRLG
jgi:hypothetical protein